MAKNVLTMFTTTVAIKKLTDENQQWQELAQKLNSENRLLQKQNSELLNLNSN